MVIFQGLDDNPVWINPGAVVAVQTAYGPSSITGQLIVVGSLMLFAGGANVAVKGDPASIAQQLQLN
jgi:hypothetical protein